MNLSSLLLTMCSLENLLTLTDCITAESKTRTGSGRLAIKFKANIEVREPFFPQLVTEGVVPWILVPFKGMGKKGSPPTIF